MKNGRSKKFVSLVLALSMLLCLPTFASAEELSAAPAGTETAAPQLSEQTAPAASGDTQTAAPAVSGDTQGTEETQVQPSAEAQPGDAVA